MTNSSSRSERLAPAALGAAALAAAAGGLAAPWLAVAGSAAAGLALVAVARSRRAAPPPAAAPDATDAELRAAVAQVTDVLRGAFRGDLETRIAPTPTAEPGHSLAVAANDFIDVSDAFLRESRASLEKIAVGAHHRRFLARGLDGAHAAAARAITEATIAIGESAHRFRGLTDEIERTVVGLAAELDGSAASLSDHARGLAGAVAKAGDAAREIDNRAGETAAAAASAVGLADEMSGALAAVAERTEAAREMAGRVAEEMAATGETVRQLIDGTERIGRVVDLIRGVSEQTNLLAVNAMIEAARSGQAGAGFAVVAREVQALARQTAAATRDIETQMRETRDAARRTAEAVGAAKGSIADMAGHAAETAAETGRQRASVASIADGLGAVSAGTAEVSRLIDSVAEAVAAASGRSDGVGREAAEVHGRARGISERLCAYTETARNR